MNFPATVLEALDRRGVQERNGELVTICPIHDDSSPSLRVKMGSDGRVLFRCDPCGDAAKFLDICRGLDIEPADCFPESLPRVPGGREPSAIYTYTDVKGRPIHRKLKYAPGLHGEKKSFVQQHWDGREWVNGAGEERTLYRMPELVTALDRHEMVWLCEGESDVEAVRQAGGTATTNANGASERWDTRFTPMFRGATVTIAADADDAGRNRARRLVEELARVNANIRVVEAAVGNDMRDHLAAGKTLAEVLVTRPFDRVMVKDTWFLREFIERQRNQQPYVLDGLLKRRERLMIVAAEGEGKSELLRQLAVKGAAGVTTFGDRCVTPQRVLVVDGENEHEDVIESYEHYCGLAVRTGCTDDFLDRLVITEASANRGRNLLREADQEWLRERVEAYRPDLITLGPLYKLCRKSLRDDETAQEVCDFLDSLREICGSAIAVEHHAPWRNGSDKEREIRPYGSSVLQRWVNFAFGLVPDQDNGGYHWQPLRGSRIRGRAWPERLEIGGKLDWRWVEGAPIPREQKGNKLNGYAHR